MRIRRHRLQQDDATPLPWRRSPNQSAGLEAAFVVMHYTAGGSAEGSIAWLTNPAARASAHLVVGRDGAITQLVAFDRRAWHAGRSRWQQLEGMNRYSIGIELDNGGPLQRRADGWTTAFGTPVDPSQVVEAPHKNGGPLRAWQAYPEVQLLAAAEVANLLVRHYDLEGVLGHDDVAPGRKTDPGPAFPMHSFSARVMGRADDEDRRELVQTTTVLHIRMGPGTAFEKLPQSPLPAGSKLEVLDQRDSWRQVLVLDALDGDMDVEGWVHGRYVTPVT